MHSPRPAASSQEDLDQFTTALTAEARECLAAYERGRALRLAGDLFGAERVLLPATRPPSIYKGLYRELLMVYRAWNRIDFKSANPAAVVDRCGLMKQLDDEMIAEMLAYWSEAQQRELPADYFDASRNYTGGDEKLRQRCLKEMGSVAGLRARKTAGK